MEKYLYGRGWNIRGAKLPHGLHPFLYVCANNSTKLTRTNMKGADFPWARFISKEAAENFLALHPIEGATAVQPLKSKYFELVDDGTGLYKVVGEDNPGLMKYGLDNISFLEDGGKISSLPPLTTNNGLNYLFDDFLHYWNSIATGVGTTLKQNKEKIKTAPDTELETVYYFTSFHSKGIDLQFTFNIKSTALFLFDLDNFNEIMNSCESYDPEWRTSRLWKDAPSGGKNWELEGSASVIKVDKAQLYKVLLTLPALQQYPDYEHVSEIQLRTIKKFLLGEKGRTELRDALYRYLQKFIDDNEIKVNAFAKEIVDRCISENAVEEFDESLNDLSLTELFDHLYNKIY